MHWVSISIRSKESELGEHDWITFQVHFRCSARSAGWHRVYSSLWMPFIPLDVYRAWTIMSGVCACIITSMPAFSFFLWWSSLENCRPLSIIRKYSIRPSGLQWPPPVRWALRWVTWQVIKFKWQVRWHTTFRGRRNPTCKPWWLWSRTLRSVEHSRRKMIWYLSVLSRRRHRSGGYRICSFSVVQVFSRTWKPRRWSESITTKTRRQQPYLNKEHLEHI